MVVQSPLRSHSSLQDSSVDLDKLEDDRLVRAVLESWIDGVLVLTEQGEWIQSNDAARRICHRLTKGEQTDSVPKEIWRICQTLIQARTIYPEGTAIVEAEIAIAKSTLRVRVRWFESSPNAHPYLIVFLEDRHESAWHLAIAEVDRYRLTPREAEVWLLHRDNYTYKEIAAELYITTNTVKKHIKSIHAKRQNVLYMEDIQQECS